MPELPTVSIREARDHLTDIVDRAEREDIPTVITRRGQEVAAVVSIETLRLFQRWEEQELNRVIDERTKGDGYGVPIEEIIAETMTRPET